jgi:hypothetical protein
LDDYLLFGDMKKLIMILAVAAVLGAIATAQAFKAGSYAGATQSERAVSFSASKTEVTAFKIKVQYACTDFDTFWTREKGFPALKVGEEGRFAARFTNADGSFTSKVKGMLTGRTARGSFLAERTYNGRGKLDPDGRVSCYVHKTKWTAERKPR